MNAHTRRVGMPPEAELAKRWAALAKSEGHKPKAPVMVAAGNTRKNATPIRVLAFLADGEWRTYDEIMEAVGLSRCALGHIIGRQITKGNIERRRVSIKRNGHSTSKVYVRGIKDAK